MRTREEKSNNVNAQPRASRESLRLGLRVVPLPLLLRRLRLSTFDHLHRLFWAIPSKRLETRGAHLVVVDEELLYLVHERRRQGIELVPFA